MPHDRRVPLRGGEQILDAVVDHLDGPAGLARQDRGVARQHRRILFLAAEAAAGFGLNDAHLVRRQVQQHDQRLVHVVRALQRSIDGHLAVARHRDHAVGLDIELFLVAGAVFPFNHAIRIPQSAIEIAFVDRDPLEAEVRGLGIVVGGLGHALEGHALVDVDEGVLVGMGDEQDRLGDMLDRIDRQARLIGIDQRDVVLAGNVAMIGGDELGRQRHMARGDPPARNRGANGRAIEHAREAQVVDVFRRADDLGVTVLTPDVRCLPREPQLEFCPRIARITRIGARR